MSRTPPEECVAGRVPKLRLSFESAEAFQREYDSNLSNGGVFVQTDGAFALRDAVAVELAFEYAGRSIVLDGEVVHIVPPQMTSIGGTAGVAVQLQMPVQELRDRLGELAAKAASDPHADGGVRGARRRSVRVLAEIRSGNRVVPGETRNLSLSGALIGVADGDSIPVDDAVRVVLTHPTSGESRKISGRVVRLVELSGEVSALAIEFLPEDAREAGTHRFIEDLQNFEHTRRLGGITGPIEPLGPQSLLQMFATTAPSGSLLLRSGQEEGVICFESGLLRLARLGTTTGMKALVRMLSWTDGTFEFHTHIDEREVTEEPFPLEAALLDAVRQIDEVTRVDRGRFPLRARLVRREDGDFDAFGQPSKVEAALLDLAGAGFTVQRALEVIPEPDPEIFRALQALTEAELLELAT